MSSKKSDTHREASLSRPAPAEPSARGIGNWRYFESRLPILQGLPPARIREIAAKARPGETWKQAIARLEGEQRAHFLDGLKPCRLCRRVEHYQTEACKQMGICDNCNARLEAELFKELDQVDGHPATVPPAYLVLALGADWIACDEAMPWNDWRSDLRYVVYSPAYDGELFVCRFSLHAPAWWCAPIECGVSGVTHWRLASSSEQQMGVVEAPLPGQVSSVQPGALARLRHWWAWFKDEHQLHD